MNFAGERASIEGRMAAMWDTAAAAVDYQNVPFDAPKDGDGAPLPFVRLAIVNGPAANQDILGNGSIRAKQTGRIWCQCFQAENTGQDAARGLADAFAAIFENARFDGIRCYAADLSPVGNDGNGYFQINVSIPYTRFQ